jgi:hypothetical protein
MDFNCDRLCNLYINTMKYFTNIIDITMDYEDHIDIIN